jgi:hypothetical protein
MRGESPKQKKVVFSTMVASKDETLLMNQTSLLTIKLQKMRRLKVMAFEFPQDAENYCRGIWDSKETGGRKFVTEQKVQKGKCSARETCYLSFSNNSSKTHVPEDGLTYVHRSSTRSIDGQRKVIVGDRNSNAGRKKQNAVHTTFSNIDSSAACAMHRDAGRESEAEESGFFYNGGLQGRDASDESNKSTNNKITKNEEAQSYGL